jgi:hypothetical protein
MNESEDFHVEYWTRQEWQHIEAHADIDENLAKQGVHQPFWYPHKGPVHYLQVVTDIRGPTCLFVKSMSGGDLLRQQSVELVTVPAVSGRLLHFCGNMLHAVPRPSDLWLLPFVPHSMIHRKLGVGVLLYSTLCYSTHQVMCHSARQMSAKQSQMQYCIVIHCAGQIIQWNKHWGWSWTKNSQCQNMAPGRRTSTRPYVSNGQDVCTNVSKRSAWGRLTATTFDH